MPKGIYQHKLSQGFQKGHPVPESWRSKFRDNGKKPQFVKLLRKNLGTGMLGRKHSSKTKKKMAEKASLWQKGKPKLWARKANPKTDESKLWRRRIEYRLWREAVFARDNWRCQRCKKRGGVLHPHHIRPFAKFKEFRFAIDNGVALCIKCHKRVHKIHDKRFLIES